MGLSENGVLGPPTKTNSMRTIMINYHNISQWGVSYFQRNPVVMSCCSKKTQLWINFAILCRNNRSISNHWGKESLCVLRIPQIDWHKRAQRAGAVVFLCWLNPYVRWIGHWNVACDYTKPPFFYGGFLKWGILKTMAFNTTVVYFGWFGVPPHFRKHLFFNKNPHTLKICTYFPFF